MSFEFEPSLEYCTDLEAQEVGPWPPALPPPSSVLHSEGLPTQRWAYTSELSLHSLNTTLHTCDALVAVRSALGRKCVGQVSPSPGGDL